MRFELIGRTKAKFCKVSNSAHKLGQKKTVPEINIRVLVTVANTVLEMFDPSLRTFLYEKNGQAAKVQKQLDGVEVITDLPQLRQAGVKLGALHWNEEVTGAKLIIDRGLGGRSNMVVEDCTLSDFKLVPKDGGTTQVFFTLKSTDVDRDSLGDLSMLHQHDVQIEVEAPAPSGMQQKPLQEDPFPADTPGKVTTIKRGRKGIGTDAEQAERQRKSLAEDDAKANQNSPEAALAKAAGLPA